MNIVIWLIIGAIAGWLAGNIMKGGGFGLIGNIVVGIIGSIIGGFFFSASGLITSILVAVVGAVILLFVVGLIRR